MAIPAYRGFYSLLTYAQDVLRANYAGIQAEINTGLSGVITLPDVDPSAIYASDGRIQPQATAWMLVTARQDSTRSLGVGVEDVVYTLVVVCGHRAQQYKDAPVEPTTEATGWEQAALMARAAQTLLERHLPEQDGVLLVTAGKQTQNAFDRRRYGAFRQEIELQVRIRQQDGFGTSTP